MSLLRHSLSAISTEVVLSLKENRVRESREIEFKRDYSLAGDREKREFVCDVVALANTVGGDLVFGVEEADGVASAINGIPEIKEDEERRRIESLLASGISPRLSGLDYKAVPIEGGKHVFIVRVPRSLNAPHMVTYNSDFRFYGRHSSGRFPMDVHQVRDGFSEQDLVANKLRGFRENRISWIREKEVGARLPSSHLVVVHLLPLAALRGGQLFDGRTLQRIESSKLRPLRDMGSFGPVLNLDGLRVHASMPDRKIVGYVQLFRNGCVEVVDSDMLFAAKKLVPRGYESIVRDGIHRLVETMRELEIEGPIAGAISLLSVKGFSTQLNDGPFSTSQPIEHENLILPEFILEGGATGEEIDASLRVPFDLVWNACGHSASPNFDAGGKWTKRS